MAVNPQEIFERYIYFGAMTRNADALAEMFAPDGVLEAPLVPAGHAVPRRLEGHEEIRTGMAAYYERSTAVHRPVNAEKTRYVLHATSDPDVFIVEIDAVFDDSEEPATMSLVQIFRLRDGKITMVRDYFAPQQAE